MARALFEAVVQETDGDIPAAGTSVVLYEEDGTTPLATPLYAASSGGSALGTTTLTTDSLGRVQAYADTAKRIKTKVGSQTPVLNAIWPDPGNILTLDGNQTLSNKTITDSQLEDIVIAGIVKRRETGPMIFDLEAYVYALDPTAFRTDGTIENDYDTSEAWDDLHTAVQASTTGPLNGGGYTGGRVIRCGSPVITALRTINWTAYSSCTIVSTAPGAITTIYSTDNWAGPAAGTPAYVLWAAAGLTEAQRAARAPMADATRMQNCLVWGFTFAAQKHLVSATAPSRQPAVGLLSAATEVYDTAASPGAWDASGGDCNNNTYRQVSGIGWTKYADLAFVNAVICTLDACSGQSYTNDAASRSLYMGKTTLNATTGNPDATGTAFDSIWYPNPTVAATGDRRLARSEISNGDHVIIRTEWHDMYPTVAGQNGNPGTSNTQTNKQSTLLFHEITGLEVIDMPISSSGVAQIDLWGQCQNVNLSNAQNYNKGGSSARSNYFIRSMGVNISNPHKAITITQLQGTTAPQIGWIGCGTDSADDSPAWVQLNVYDNNLNGTVPFFKTLASYSGAATEVNLAYSDIDLNGCTYEFGGSIGPTVTLRNVPTGGAGDEQVSGGGGYNRARRHYIDGTVRMYGPLTVDTGNITATAGSFAGRHFVGNQVAASGDFAISAGWGTGAAMSVIRGGDNGFHVRVTAGTTPGANPTLTYTFKTARTNFPVVTVDCVVGDSAFADGRVFRAPSTTNVVLTLIDTPTASRTYDFDVVFSEAR